MIYTLIVIHSITFVINIVTCHEIVHPIQARNKGWIRLILVISLILYGRYQFSVCSSVFSSFKIFETIQMTVSYYGVYIKLLENSHNTVFVFLLQS